MNCKTEKRDFLSTDEEIIVAEQKKEEEELLRHYNVVCNNSIN